MKMSILWLFTIVVLVSRPGAGEAVGRPDAEMEPQIGPPQDDLYTMFIEDQQQPAPDGDPAASRPERQTSHFQRFVIGSQNFRNEAPPQGPLYRKPSHQEPLYREPVHEEPLYRQPAHEEHYTHHVAEHVDPYQHKKASYGKTVHEYHHSKPDDHHHEEYEHVHYEHKDPYFQVEEDHHYEDKEPHQYEHQTPYHKEPQLYEHNVPHHEYEPKDKYPEEYTHHHGPYEIKVKYDKKEHSFADDLVEQYLKNKLEEASKELGLHSKITTIIPNGNAPTVSVHSSQPALAINGAHSSGVTVHHPATAHSPAVTVHHPAEHHSVTVQHPDDHHTVTVQHPDDPHSVTVHHPTDHHAVNVQHPVDHHSVTVHHPTDHHEVTVHNTPAGVAVHHTEHHINSPATVAVHTPGHTVVHEGGHAVHVANGPAVHVATPPALPVPLPPGVPIPGLPLPSPFPGPTPIPGLIPVNPLTGLPVPVNPLTGLPVPTPSVPLSIDSLINLLQANGINLTPKGAIGQLPHPSFPDDDYSDYDEFRGFSPEFLDDEDYFIIDSKLNDNDDVIDTAEDTELDTEQLRFTDGSKRDRLEKLRKQRKRLSELLSNQKSTLSGVLGNDGGPLLSRLTSLNSKMSNLQDNLSKCGQEGARQQLRLANLENAARFQKDYADQKDQQIKQLLSTIDTLEEQTQSFKEKISSFEHEIDVISNELNSKDQTLANLKDREIRQFSQLQNLLQNKQKTIKSQIDKIDGTASKLVEMQREIRRGRERHGQLRSLIHTRNEEIGLLNNEKDNLVGVVKDLARLNFKNILDEDFARNTRHTKTRTHANNIKVMKILEKFHIDPKEIMNSNKDASEIIDQQEKAIFADLAITTASPPEYSTMAEGEAVEETLVENQYVDDYGIMYNNGEEVATEETEQTNENERDIEDNYDVGMD